MKTVEFKKTNGKADRVTFFLSGVRLAEMDNPKQGIVPHDLIHFAVETSFQLKGFIALVFSGQKPEFAMTSDGEAWLAEALVEGFQACLWQDGFPGFLDFQSTVENICLMRNSPPPSANETCYLKCRTLLEDLSNRWKVLEVGEKLILSY